MKLRYTISIFLIICYCSYSYSQLSTLTFKHLTFKQGLSNSKINVIYKDSQGYVWFGTEDGLNKFDGYDITTYRYNPNDSNSLATNQINCLFENSKKQLIVGDSRRMSIYDRRFDNFRPIYIKDTLGNIIGGKVRSIVEDKNGNYWLALGYKGLIWLDRNFRTLKMYSYAKDLNNIHKCYLDRKGRIIVFFNSYGLFEFDKNTQKFRNIYKNPDVSDYQNCVSTSFVDNNDNYWIGLNNGKVSKISIQKNDTLIEHFFQATGNRVSCISQDKEGNIWVATENEGIFNLSKNGIEFKNYKKNELQNTLSILSISRLYCII